ncbi:hypothetical protein JW964_12030 [candidate division KSB1 bacterium]|nr:hypothetical protein [candidate division KSB1 bacterium]
MNIKKLVKFFIIMITVIWFSLGHSQTYSDLRVEGHIDPAANEQKIEAINSLLTSGRELHKIGVIPSAILAYQNAINIDPANQIARMELAKIALEIKNWAYAIRMLDELSALRKNDIESREMLMNLYNIFEITISKLKTARELLALSPTDTSLLRRMAEMYHKQEMYSSEIAVLEQLIKLVPNQSKHYWQLAQLYAHKKDETRQLAMYNRLRKLEPQNVKLLKRLAQLYGALGDVEQQITCYHEILNIEKENEPVKKAVILAYGDAVTGPLIPFNVKQARHNLNQYLRNHSGESRFQDISRALRYASHPSINYDLLNHSYNFFSKTTNLENKVDISMAGPLPNSRMMVSNSYSILDIAKKPRPEHSEKAKTLNDAQFFHLLTGWQQKVNKFQYQIQAGMHQLMGDLGEKAEGTPHFISNIQLSYSLQRKLQLSGEFDLNYSAWTIEALQANISRQRLGIDLTYLPGENFQINTQFQIQKFSDDNSSNMFACNFEYYLIRKPIKIKDLEADLPVGFDENGMNLSLGVGYEYLNFDKERIIYPTTIDEHFFQFLLTGDWQMIPSLFSKTTGFFGMNTQDQKMWGYQIEIRKQFNWLMHLTAGFENYQSPYILDKVHLINTEKRFYLKGGLGF